MKRQHITGRALYEEYLRITQATTQSSAGLVSWHLMVPEGQKVMNDLADWINNQREPLTISVSATLKAIEGDTTE